MGRKKFLHVGGKLTDVVVGGGGRHTDAIIIIIQRWRRRNRISVVPTWCRGGERATEFRTPK